MHICLRDIQFFKVMVGGVRHERAASASPFPPHVSGRFGFCFEVEVS
jgi:hypothetical protein